MTPMDKDAWLAQDEDMECPVYLVVHAAGADAQDPRWSVAWPVGRGNLADRMTTAWRYIKLEAGYDPLASEFDTPYAYLGPITKTLGPEILGARRFALGTTTLAMRRRIDGLARGIAVPAQTETGQWTCRDWVKGLLERMVAAGMVSSELCCDVVARATSGA